MHIIATSVPSQSTMITSIVVKLVIKEIHCLLLKHFFLKKNIARACHPHCLWWLVNVLGVTEIRIHPPWLVVAAYVDMDHQPQARQPLLAL